VRTGPYRQNAHYLAWLSLPALLLALIFFSIRCIMLFGWFRGTAALLRPRSVLRKFDGPKGAAEEDLSAVLGIPQQTEE
jgi:hypothetical protein